MGDTSESQAAELRPLAAEFGPLSHAENLLLQNIPRGKPAVCGPNDDDKDKRNAPKHADDWEPARQIRKELIAWLCSNKQAREFIPWRGILVYGADIRGHLDLEFVNIPFPLKFQVCRIREDINLYRAKLPQLSFQGTLVQAIKADGLLVENGVFLTDGFMAHGAVSLPGAQIGGDLDCDGAAFTTASGPALNAQGANVKSAILLRGSRADGEVRLVGVEVGLDLDCEGGTFTNQGGDAFTADKINVQGSVFLRNGFAANGGVSASGRRNRWQSRV